MNFGYFRAFPRFLWRWARRGSHRELPGGEERSTSACCGVVRVSLVNVANRRPAPEKCGQPHSWVKIWGFRFFRFHVFLVLGFVVQVSGLRFRVSGSNKALVPKIKNIFVESRTRTGDPRTSQRRDPGPRTKMKHKVRRGSGRTSKWSGQKWGKMRRVLRAHNKNLPT